MAKKVIKDASGAFVFDNGSKLEQLNLTVEDIINTSIVLYGPSKTGKSFTISDFLGVLAKHVSYGIVVCPTNIVDYKKVFPKSCIFADMKPQTPSEPKKGKKKKNTNDEVVEFLTEIVDRQLVITNLYKATMDIEVLKRLFSYIPPSKKSRCILELLTRINIERYDYIQEIDSKKIDPVEKKNAKDKVNGTFTSLMITTFQEFIKENIDLIIANKAAPEDDVLIAKSIGINPNMVLVMDDVAADLKPILKEKVFRKLFYQGRHHSITLIISCQDDTDLATNLRKNAFITICTTETIASSLFERSSNKYSKKLIDQTKLIIDTIYADKYMKLVFFREKNKFYYYMPQLRPPVKIGPKLFWDLCEDVEVKKPIVTTKNKFTDLFITSS